MKEVLTTTAIAGTTGFLAWLFPKLLTRRERKKSDLQLINEAVMPLVTSVKQLTEQNNEIVGRLMAEQDKVIGFMAKEAAWLKEKGALLEKIEKLEKTVHCLQKRINEFIKKQENEN